MNKLSERTVDFLTAVILCWFLLPLLIAVGVLIVYVLGWLVAGVVAVILFVIPFIALFAKDTK